jgi:hypothetical protein
MTNPTDDAVEAVARAICHENNPCWSMVAEVFEDGRVDGTGRTAGDVYRDAAHAAITAYREHLKAEGMVIIPREPTEAMVDAASSGYDSAGYGITDSDAASAYRAMITAHEDE